ncbi:hypothetical protein ABH926_001311 [Catenulispora sp. GP43]|uniref:hypothetical protein n=1 Tax=Catenulispora sp. GP43 TaxID=3156263 RepID=UPI003515E883
MDDDFEPDYHGGFGRPCHVEARIPAPPPPPAFGARPSMAHYRRALRHFVEHPDRAGVLTHLRELTIQGLKAGSLSTRDVLFEVRPAAVAVSVLAEREVAAAGPVLAAVIRAAVADHPSRWAYLVDQVDFWPGSLASLLTGRRDIGVVGYLSVPPSRPRAWIGHLWRPANILLALAPAEGARRFFTEATGRTAVWRAGSAERMAGYMPLSRALVEYTLSPRGSRRARANLAGNAFAPDAVLALLLERPGEAEIAMAVREHDFAGGAVRRQAYLAVRDRPDAVRKSLAKLLEHGQKQFLDLLAAAPEDDAVWMHSLIKLAGDWLQPQTRRTAYGRLAAVSEPEVVWSLALAYAGSIEALAPEVRASMVEGSAAPLAAAVRDGPFWDLNAGVNAAAAEMRREEVLDRPLPWLH